MNIKEYLKASHTGFLTIAHRGASAMAPENTMAAFVLAQQAGADMIELDVLPNADGIPMVIHDTDLHRLTGVKGDIREMTSAQLSEFRITLMKRKGFGAEAIPSLREVLRWAKGNILLNIEIKPEGYPATASPGIADSVMALISEHEMQHSTLISSFSRYCIEYIRKTAPELSTGILYDKKVSAGLSPVDMYHQTGTDTLHISYRRASHRLLDQAKTEQIPLLIYTVNRKRTMKRLIKQGVKGIFTDKPALLKKTVLELESQ